MAQVKPEHARRRLGIRAPKAVAAVGIAVVASLGLMGALRMQDQGFHLVPAASIDHAVQDDGTHDHADSPSGEPLLLPETVVHVDGAVAHPGVYTLVGETVRVCDAVEAAGGLADDADTAALNLAQPVVDGGKVHVPAEGEVRATQLAGEGASSDLVNLNTATAEELTRLPGVGERTAQAILQSREDLGPFTSIDDLLRVSGIGEKKLEKIRPHACI